MKRRNDEQPPSDFYDKVKGELRRSWQDDASAGVLDKIWQGMAVNDAVVAVKADPKEQKALGVLQRFTRRVVYNTLHRELPPFSRASKSVDSFYDWSLCPEKPHPNLLVKGLHATPPRLRDWSCGMSECGDCGVADITAVSVSVVGVAFQQLPEHGFRFSRGASHGGALSLVRVSRTPKTFFRYQLGFIRAGRSRSRYSKLLLRQSRKRRRILRERDRASVEAGFGESEKIKPRCKKYYTRILHTPPHEDVPRGVVGRAG